MIDSIFRFPKNKCREEEGFSYTSRGSCCPVTYICMKGLHKYYILIEPFSCHLESFLCHLQFLTNGYSENNTMYVALFSIYSSSERC